jgi:hypothetical protein
MAIQNIHILINDPVSRTPLTVEQTAIIQLRIAEHRNGLHTYGNMRRDCPLCK